MDESAARGLPRLQSLHLKDQAYDQIKTAITSLRFKPGDPIIEGDLARLLGISKTPVRNALIRLENEGLVRTVPFRGTFVAGVLASDVLEVYQVRGALEELAIRLLISSITDEDIEHLRTCVANASQSVEEGRLEDSFDAIREFHEGLVALAGNRWLTDIYANLGDHLTRIRNICGHIPGRVEKSDEEHAQIIDALAAGDTRGAMTTLREHLVSLTEDYSRVAEEMLIDAPDLAGEQADQRAGGAVHG